MPATNTSSIVTKCTRILDIVAGSHRGLGFADIVAQSGYVKSSTHRVLAILLNERLVEYDDRHRCYRLGSRLMGWAVNALRSTDLQKAARAELESLCDRTGHNVALAIRDEASVLYLQTVESYPLRYVTKVGDRGPIHCTAVGKVLAAFTAGSHREELIAAIRFEKYTEHTIVERNAFETELAIVRKHGYAICDREEFLRVCGYAAPVFDIQADIVGAVCLWSKVSDADIDSLYDFLPDLLNATKRLSEKLGFQENGV